jgi:intracellular sulfur oxidation DsrE/DsrF family protein
MYRIATIIALLAAFLTTPLAHAAQADKDKSFASAHYVLQVSQDDPARWTLAMNNAANLQAHFGPDNVDVVIVAYGPGLKMLLKNAKDATRVQSLATSGVEFDACHNTMKGMERKLGHMPAMNSAATVVPAGVVRIGELQQKGYIYIKP